MGQYIYISLVFILSIQTEAAHSECEVPAALKGSVAFVTCRFDSDISKLRQDFEVRRVPVNVSAINAEIILSCHWKHDKILCKSRPDYQLDSPVTRQFTVKITEVGNQHAGKFICMLVSHDPGTYEYCELVVTDRQCWLFSISKGVIHRNACREGVQFRLFTCFKAENKSADVREKDFCLNTLQSMQSNSESQTSTFHTSVTTTLNTFEEGYTRSVRHNEDTGGFSILNGNESEQHKELNSTLPTDVHGNSLAITLAITAGVTILAIFICVIVFILRRTECCKHSRFSKGDKGANQNSTEENLITNDNVINKPP